MTRPRLLIISFSTIASDARVLKQVRRLSLEYEVHTVGYGDAPVEVESHIRIPDDLPSWQYDRVAVILRRYRRAYWTNRAIAFAAHALEGTTWDLVIGNDVESAGIALAQQSTYGVHMDLHEYAPRQKEEILRWRVFLAPFVRWMLRTFVTRVDSVSTLGTGIADEYRREFGIEAVVVTNATPLHDLHPTPVSEPIRLVHSGAGLRDRNLLLMAQAAVGTSTNVTLDFYLTANNPDYIQELRDFAAGSGGRVRVHDPVAYADLISTLNAYDIGVFMLPPVNFNYRWTLPNKFFDYVQARLGVIIGPSPEMVRILEECDLGAVTADFDEASLTRVLDGLTVDVVAGWKRAADDAADELSGEAQTEIWADALRALQTAPRGARR